MFLVLERDIEKPVCTYATRRGWEVLKLTGRDGIPDRMFLKAGFTGFIEFKKPDEPPEEKQLANVRRLLRRGFSARVIDSRFYGEKLIDYWETIIDAGPHFYNRQTRMVWTRETGGANPGAYCLGSISPEPIYTQGS